MYGWQKGYQCNNFQVAYFCPSCSEVIIKDYRICLSHSMAVCSVKKFYTSILQLVTINM
jgi:hypothetical protein